MPITYGSLSTRIWRVNDALPPEFAEGFERKLQRHAFRPVDAEKTELRSIGWTNIRQPLDTHLTMDKILFRDKIALGLRVDRVSINQRMLRARLSLEVDKVMKSKGKERLGDEQRAAIEDKIRQEMIKNQPPSISLYEMVWHLETGLVFFGSTGNKINSEFSELFVQTFDMGIEPQLPLLRGLRWAKKHRLEQELRELLPAPYSPKVPAQVVEVRDDGKGDE